MYRTMKLAEGSPWSSPMKNILTAVTTSSTPNTIRIHENSDTSAAPMAIMMPRITSAPRIPQNSTRC